MTTQKTSSQTQNINGQNHTHSNRSPTHSLDSGIYVHMEINFDDSVLSTDVQDTTRHKESNESPKIKPEVQINSGELAEKDLEDQDINYIFKSDPDLVFPTAGGLKGSSSIVTPEMDKRKALMPPSVLAIPPLLPSKRYQRCATFEKTLGQGPELKAFDEDNKPFNSLEFQTSPVLGGVKGNNQCSDLVHGEELDIHNSCTFGFYPKMQPKCPPQLPPRPPPKPPIKPPRLNKPNRAETEEEVEENKQKAEWEKHNKKMEDKRRRQEPNQIDSNEKIERNKETSGTESHLDVSKPPQQILVVFTDNGKDVEESKGRKEVEYLCDIGLATPTTTDKSSQLAVECLQEESDMVAGNTNTSSTVSAKPEPMLPPKPPPNPHQKCPPKPPMKPPQLFSTMRAETEEEKERWKQEEEWWRNKDNKKDENDRGEKDIQKEYGKDPPLAQSQDPGRQEQNTENGHVQPGPLPSVLPAQVNLIGTDSTTKTFKITKNDKEIQLSGQGGQDSEVISKLPSGFLEGTEVVRTELDACQLELKKVEDVHKIAETLPDGEPKQTNRQKTNTRGKVKNFTKKMMVKLKKGKEEKRRIRVDGMEMDGVREQDNEVTKVSYTSNNYN